MTRSMRAWKPALAGAALQPQQPAGGDQADSRSQDSGCQHQPSQDAAAVWENWTSTFEGLLVGARLTARMG